MRIIDNFLFFNEVETTQLRFNILYPYVDAFIVTEANQTFSGHSKDLNFEKNADKFVDFKDKIFYNIVEDTPETNDPWQREIFQRNAMARPLTNCKDDDIVIFSDADEIPDLRNLKTWYFPNILFRPMMKMYYFAINNFKEENWLGTCISNWGFAKQYTPDQLRNMKDGVLGVKNNGHHFSFLGDAKSIKEKIEAFSHQEFNIDIVKNNIEYNMEYNLDLFGRPDTKFEIVPIDRAYPDYIFYNQEKLAHLIRKI